MKTEPKPILVKKSVKHSFTKEEVAQLNVDFGLAYDHLRTVEAEFDSVKASYKAKTQEAESTMTMLRASINAGFEFRMKELCVVFRTADKKKDYYLVPPSEFKGSPQDFAMPVLTEDMTTDDFQQDLIQAESIFSNRKELTLWQAGNDLGLLIIGQLGAKWYSALRCNVGAIKLEERLDSEQKAFKERQMAVNVGANRAEAWLEDNLGVDTAKGFVDSLDKATKAEAGKVE